MPPNVPGLPLARPGGILPRPGMPPGLGGQPQIGGMPLQRPNMPMSGIQQQRPGGMPVQHLRLPSGGMQMNQVISRPQNSPLMQNPNGQGLLRGPPPGHRMQGPIDPRGPQPRPMEWDNRQGHPQGFQQQNQMNQRGPPGSKKKAYNELFFKIKIFPSRICRRSKWTSWWSW